MYVRANSSTLISAIIVTCRTNPVKVPGVIVRLWPWSWLRDLQGQVNPLASSENHCSKGLFRARRRGLPFAPFLSRLTELRQNEVATSRPADTLVLGFDSGSNPVPVFQLCFAERFGSSSSGKRQEDFFQSKPDFILTCKASRRLDRDSCCNGEQLSTSSIWLKRATLR